MCKYCEGVCGKEIDIEESPTCKETQPNKAQIIQLNGDKSGIVLFRYGLAQGYFDIRYCPVCGRELD